jgi:hypothetical protein
MNTHDTPIALQAGQVITLPELRDHWLLVLQGRIWLTQSGDADDHFLQTGQRLLLGNHGDVVIEADGGEPARCSLQHAWAPAGQGRESKPPARPLIGTLPAKAVAEPPAGRALGPAADHRISAA